MKLDKDGLILSLTIAVHILIASATQMYAVEKQWISETQGFLVFVIIFFLLGAISVKWNDMKKGD